MEAMRINKFLSAAGYCSRREADKLISAGSVSINGLTADLGSKVLPEDRVQVHGKDVTPAHTKPVTLAFYKPVGVVCTTNSQVEPNNIVDFIAYPERIYPVGRLDKMSEGLILLTNDGDLVNRVLRARNRHEKEYIVQVDRPLTDDFIRRMRSGVAILDTVTRPCRVEKIGVYVFRIVLTQGLNRQIRRMCEALDYRVRKLKRTRIMDLRLDVPEGKWRLLSDAEVRALKK